MQLPIYSIKSHHDSLPRIGLFLMYPQGRRVFEGKRDKPIVCSIPFLDSERMQRRHKHQQVAL